MAQDGNKKPSYRQWQFWALILGFIYFGYQSGFFGRVAWGLFGPSADQQAQQRAVYDEGMQVLEEAIRRDDPSILEQKWCGEARETAEQIVREGDKRRVSVSSVQHGLRFPGRPQIVADEVWKKGTTEMSYSINVWLGTCGCSRGPEGIPVPEYDCIIKFHPSEVMPWYGAQ